MLSIIEYYNNYGNKRIINKKKFVEVADNHFNIEYASKNKIRKKINSY